MMEITYLMLGSNVGDRMKYLNRCIELLRSDVGRVAGMSSVYESEPWGFDSTHWFLNQAVVVETHLAPLALLENIQWIEQTLGRQRTHDGYQSRTMDIDILLYGNHIINIPNLVIPHPRMTKRMFVLQPMAELAPDLEHPVLNRSMAYLKEHCTDRLQVVRVEGCHKTC